MAASKATALISASEQAAVTGAVKRHWVSIVVVGGGLVAALVLMAKTGYALTGSGLLVLAVLLWSIRKAAALGWWVRGHRRLLAKASLPAPSLRDMLAVRKQERQRIKYVVKQWEAACQVNGITGLGKVVPSLHKLRSTVDGDLTAMVSPGPLGVKGGVDKIQANCREIAETTGCLELLVRRVGVGHAVLTFLWTEQFERVVPIAELPEVSNKDLVPYGVRRDGSPATLIIGQSALICGMTRGGKSGITWSILAALIRADIKFDLYASDVKGGVEMGVLADKVSERGVSPMRLVDYAPDVDGTVRLINNFEAAMKARAAETTNRKWRVSNANEYPLGLLVFDECVEAMQEMLGGDPVDKARALRLKSAYMKLKTIQSQGAALGFMVLYLSQIADISVLGPVRKMTPQRLSLAQRTSIDTDMCLGDGAEASGAVCTQIHNRPGMGYSFDETRRGYERFRATWCNDDDIARIADGLVPLGMTGQVSEQPLSRECAVYKFWDSNGRCLYVGEGFDPEERWADHAGMRGNPAKRWWSLVDHSKTMPPQWFPSKADAKAFEAREINRLKPIGNEQHNKTNRWRGADVVADPQRDGNVSRRHLPRPTFRRKPEPDWPLLDEAPAAAVEADPQPELVMDPEPLEVEVEPEMEPSNVSPITGRRPAPSFVPFQHVPSTRTSRRRRAS